MFNKVKECLGLGNNGRQGQKIWTALVIVAFVIFVVYMIYPDMGGIKRQSSYDNITPMQHDIVKDTSMECMKALYNGLGGTSLTQFACNRLVTAGSYLFFYQILEPYISQSSSLLVNYINNKM